MAKTTNDQLQDLVVRRAVQLERYKKSLVKQLAEALSSTDERMQKRVRSILRSERGARALRLLFNELRGILDEDYSEVVKTLGKELGTLAIDEARFMNKALTDSVPLKWEAKMPSAKQLEEAAAASPSALTLDELAEAQKLNHLNFYKSTVRQAILEGAGLPRIVADLTNPRGPLGRQKGNLEMVARTAANAVSSAARQQTYRKNEDVIKGVMWVATLDSRTSVICAGLDGQIFPVDKGPRPPAHPNCRSTTVPVTRAAEEVVKRVGPAVRSSMNGEVSGGKTFGEWLKTQPEIIQDEVLGDKKARLFRAGLPIDRFTDDDLSPLNLDQLRRREPDFWSKAGL